MRTTRVAFRIHRLAWSCVVSIFGALGCTVSVRYIDPTLLAE